MTSPLGARPLHRRAGRRALATLGTALAVAVPLAVAAPSAVGPALADHTPLPSTVTVAGSLQSELGCPDDWDPACGDTDLSQVGESAVYTSQFDLPAGAYEFKVAINGAWDENYGAGGVENGANIPLVLEGAATVEMSYDHTTHLLAMSPTDLPGDVEPGDEELFEPSLRESLTDERFYFVMADRFANGNPRNDDGGITGGPLESGLDPTNKGFYHGGDLKGVIEQLDYIKGLGTTAIWLTPSFKNRAVQGTGENASAGYHGYWVTDFTQIDPHLGTNADMERLIDKAHARGMKVFFDIIVNHTADVIDYEEGQYSYISKETEPYRDADGNPFDDKEYAGTEDFPALDPEVSFPYTPVYRTPEDATLKVPAWLNDVTNYHNRGDSTFAGESSEYGDFFALDDLFTEQPDVVDGMVDIHEAWVDFGIDGFRIDTVKHVNMEMWQEFSPALLDHAAEIGNDDFFMFGEIADGSPEFLSRYTTEGKLQAALDFGFQGTAVQQALSKPTTGMRDFFAKDDYYTDSDSNAYQAPTFLGNHDMGRVGMFLMNGGATGDELLQRDIFAHQLMYVTRGQPVVYYGDEQGFTGDGGDKDARQDMFASQVESYNDDVVIGGESGSMDRYDTEAPLYQAIKEAAKLRKRHATLADGSQVHRYASNEAGIYAVSRIDREHDREYVVVANNATEPRTATFETYSVRRGFRPVFGSEDSVRADKEGRVTVTADPLSVTVYRARKPMDARTEAPDLFFRTPGQVTHELSDRAEIGVVVPDNAFAEVTFAVRSAGTEDWQVLGTDDNAPYRVFHDVTGYAAGTMLEYRAVLRDSSGNFAATSGYGLVSGSAPAAAAGAPAASHTAVQPESVAAAGSHNSEMGCPGDWQPECDQAQLTLDENDEIWKGTYTLPAGEYEYKAALNRSWDENYGLGGVLNGPNIPYSTDGSPVTFYYDNRTHWVSSDAEVPIITVPGSFQSEMGCAADWDPACMRSWLQDPDADGVFTLATTEIPAGSYEAKVAHGLSWDENYGEGGVPGGNNIPFTVGTDGEQVTFSYVLETHVLTITTSTPGGQPDLTTSRAIWVNDSLLAWPADALPDDTPPEWMSWRLHFAEEAGLTVDAEAIVGGDSEPLRYDPAGIPADVVAAHPEVTGYLALYLDDVSQGRTKDILRGQVAVGLYDDLGALRDASGVQVPHVLDDLYDRAADKVLGVRWGKGTPTFKVWAPTAQQVTLLRWPADGAGEPERVTAIRRPTGMWRVQTDDTAAQASQYEWELEVYAPTTQQIETNVVTDPYSVSLTPNSTRSVALDLRDKDLKPAVWADTPSPELAQAVDSTIYELHVRDFSIHDEKVPAEHRGTYLAFADDGDGRAHLEALAAAGLNTIHLLPTFDIASIPELESEQEEPPCDLASYPPDSPEQQACILQVADQDAFNWGYDPYHWLAPEGSYATEPDGVTRVVEYRTMVGALHESGLRVVRDEVYNHTAQAGQGEKSVLDQVVPGYYHRLDPRGSVYTSTCCQNIATEHAMAEKLMVDGTVLWARDYKVDGFRFDLMGHHSKANMLAVREALDELTLEDDGVDGESIYLYGEGWNFGEVANNALFEQATQGQLGGTGIGTFSDRLRDAVRGGGPFDEDPRIQGFGSGLYTDPNEATPGTPEEQAASLAHATDLVQLGLAGNLRDFAFRSAETGEVVAGDEVDYNGQPAGYAEEPDEVVTYVDAHDNETLWDALTYKLPVPTEMSDRIRMNTLSLSTTALAQTPSFWHAGTDLLRSKSLDRNSYNSGDWFNWLDWTGEDNGFGHGLPPAPDNEDKWPYAQPLLANPDLKPTQEEVLGASAVAQDLLRLRFSTPLFRLGSAALIEEKLSYPVSGTSGAVPGVIVMRLDDTVGADVDPALAGALVVFNASTEPVTQTVSGLVGEAMVLSPVQATGSDEVVKGTTWDAATGAVTVPARTVAVLVQPQD